MSARRRPGHGSRAGALARATCTAALAIIVVQLQVSAEVRAAQPAQPAAGAGVDCRALCGAPRISAAKANSSDLQWLTRSRRFDYDALTVRETKTGVWVGAHDVIPLSPEGLAKQAKDATSQAEYLYAEDPPEPPLSQLAGAKGAAAIRRIFFRLFPLTHKNILETTVLYRIKEAVRMADWWGIAEGGYRLEFGYNETPYESPDEDFYLAHLAKLMAHEVGMSLSYEPAEIASIEDQALTRLASVLCIEIQLIEVDEAGEVSALPPVNPISTARTLADYGVARLHILRYQHPKDGTPVYEALGARRGALCHCSPPLTRDFAYAKGAAEKKAQRWASKASEPAWRPSPEPAKSEEAPPSSPPPSAVQPSPSPTVSPLASLAGAAGAEAAEAVRAAQPAQPVQQAAVQEETPKPQETALSSEGKDAQKDASVGLAAHTCTEARRDREAEKHLRGSLIGDATVHIFAVAIAVLALAGVGAGTALKWLFAGKGGPVPDPGAAELRARLARAEEELSSTRAEAAKARAEAELAGQEAKGARREAQEARATAAARDAELRRVRDAEERGRRRAEEARRAAELEGERKLEKARKGEAAAVQRAAEAAREAAEAGALAKKAEQRVAAAEAALVAACAENAALRQAAERPAASSAAAALDGIEAGLSAMGHGELSALVARLGTVLAAGSRRLAAAPRERECAVCFQVRPEEQMRVLHPCMHGYCEACVERLQAGGQPCPRCRRPFTRASRVFMGDAPSALLPTPAL